MSAILKSPPPAPAPRRTAAGRRGRLRLLIPFLLTLSGVIVLLYPVIATQYNNVKQREFASQYDREVEQASPIDLSADLERARAYNAKLEGVPILDPWLLQASGPPESGAYSEYESQLNRFPVLARIKVPTADIDLPVYHGTSDAVIAKGAGHLYGTSLPVGGPDSHAVLTSHTGMASATLFDHLTRVQQGDLMFVEVSGETLAYQVDQVKVVLPTQISDLTTVKGHDYLTLFTCTPYAINTHRLLVRGERVPFTADVSKVASRLEGASVVTMEPWMWWLVAVAVAGLLALLVGAWREWRWAKNLRVLGGRAVGGGAGPPRGRPPRHLT